MILPVSLVIPCFKRISQTKKTIDLILQSVGLGKDFSLEIIIADCTPDNSLKDMLASFSFPIKYVRPERAGIAANKNAGAKIAKHELLIFCDSDMEVEKETLRIAINSLSDRSCTAMLTGQIIWKKNGITGEVDRPRKEDRIETTEKEQYLEAIYSRFLITYKSIFWQVGGYDQDLFNMRGEGSDLSIRYWRAGFPLGFNPAIKIYHVHEAEEAITRNIEHPERGVIRDLIQLGYKYGLDRSQSGNFAKTLNWLVEQFGQSDKYVLIKSFVSLLPYFWDNQALLQTAKEMAGGQYDFKFLDVFTKKELFLDCLDKAKDKLSSARKAAFLL